MRSHQVRLQRYGPRTCLQSQEIGRPLPDALYQHVCELPRAHFGPHLCWCGLAFGRGIPRWAQPPLPGMGAEEHYRE